MLVRLPASHALPSFLGATVASRRAWIHRRRSHIVRVGTWLPVNSTPGQLVTRSSRHTVYSSQVNSSVTCAFFSQSQLVTWLTRHTVISSHGQLITQSTRHKRTTEEILILLLIILHLLHANIRRQRKANHRVTARLFTFRDRLVAGEWTAMQMLRIFRPTFQI